jgi:transposase
MDQGLERFPLDPLGCHRSYSTSVLLGPTGTLVGYGQWHPAHLRRDFHAMIDRGSAGGCSTNRDGFHPGVPARRAVDRPDDATVVRGGVEGSLGALLRGGASCACTWTAEVCRKILEAEQHPWTFADVEGAAPDDNAAERALRHGVNWRKLSLGARSEAGSRFVERLLSKVEACRHRRQSVASYLIECILARWGGQPIPSPHS